MASDDEARDRAEVWQDDGTEQFYLASVVKVALFSLGTDRVTFSAALGAILMRVGNLFNSEIAGMPTDGTWGVRFVRYDVSDAPLRHPIQLYEAALGVLVFVLLLICDRALGYERRPRGSLTGVFLLSYFGARFCVEFWKEHEGISPDATLNLGQLLSLPCVIAGGLILWQALRLRRTAGWIVTPAAARA